jgi:hypothetical protein
MEAGKMQIKIIFKDFQKPKSPEILSIIKMLNASTLVFAALVSADIF